MKKTIRLLCLLLTLFMVVLAAACETTPVETSSEAPADSGEPSEPEVSQEESHELFYNLPSDKTFDGETVTFLVVGDYANAYKSVEVMPQEDSFETLKINVQARNDLVSEKFGVEIAEVRTTSGADMVSKVRESSMAGICEYDIVMPYMYDAATLAMEGYFYDLNELENVHLN
ncbi:MAG: hypothetical protein J5843_00485, partial [Clostridia bacterium]|nr:hypothetical protein [Clostridia bacterium]